MAGIVKVHPMDMMGANNAKMARHHAGLPGNSPAHRSVGKAKNFIQKAIKHPGALRKTLGAKPGKPIPAATLNAAAKKPGITGKRARFAKMLKSLPHK